MGLKVIGTGFGRTGTDSMRNALNILGFGPTHHMFEVMQNPNQQAMWRDVAHRGFRDWDALFDGYNSCVDWPSAAYWRDLIDVSECIVGIFVLNLIFVFVGYKAM